MLSRDYHPDLSMGELLPAVLSSLLAAPAPEDPLNKELASLFFADARAGGGAARYELAVRAGVAEHASRPAAALEAEMMRGALRLMPPAPRAGGFAGRGRR